MSIIVNPHRHHHISNINPSTSTISSSRTTRTTTLSSSTTSDNSNLQSSNTFIVPPPSPSLSMPVWSLACCTTKYLQQQQQPTERLNDNHNDTTTTSNTTTSTATIRNRKNEEVDISLLSNNTITTNTSMNIITFCTSVSVSTIPKLYCISLYYNTFTKDSFLYNQYGILQLLRPCHTILIPILGQHSSYDSIYNNTTDTTSPKEYYNKRIECSKVGYPWITTKINPWITTKINCNNNNDNDNNNSIDNDVVETIDLIPNCCTYLYIKMIHSIPAGDHLLVLCQHLNTYQWDDTTKTIIPSISTTSTTTKSTILDHNTVLYTGQLREEGII